MLTLVAGIFVAAASVVLWVMHDLTRCYLRHDILRPDRNGLA